MMDLLAPKKLNKHLDQKVPARVRANGPVLTAADEHFFERLTASAAAGFSDVAGNRPPLPPRAKTPEYTWDSDTESYVGPRQDDNDGGGGGGGGGGNEEEEEEEEKGEDEEDKHGNGEGKENSSSSSAAGLRRGSTPYLDRLNRWVRKPRAKRALAPGSRAAAPPAAEEEEEEERETDGPLRVPGDDPDKTPACAGASETETSSGGAARQQGATRSRLNPWVRRPKAKDTLAPDSDAAGSAAAAAAAAAEEEEREKDDLSRVLDDLNLAARSSSSSSSKTFGGAPDAQALAAKFTLVLKDLVNGVPTAAADLRHLLDDHDGTLARNYERLPGSLKKMVTSLPTKLTASLAPELLAAAAASQGLEQEADAAAAGGIKEQAKKLLVPQNLADLITKPSAIVGMLKAIMNVLRLRWPAFIGTNVIWSVALFLLMFVLWYCHKRGREVRLEKEKADAAEMEGRVEELSHMDAAMGSVSTPLGLESRTSPPLLETPETSARGG